MAGSADELLHDEVLLEVRGLEDGEPDEGAGVDDGHPQCPCVGALCAMQEGGGSTASSASRSPEAMASDHLSIPSRGPQRVDRLRSQVPGKKTSEPRDGLSFPFASFIFTCTRPCFVSLSQPENKPRSGPITW